VSTIHGNLLGLFIMADWTKSLALGQLSDTRVCEVAAAPRHVVWEILGRLWWWVTDMKCTNEVAFWLR